MGRPSLPVRGEGRPSLLIKASKKRKDYLRKEIFGGCLFSMQGKVEICGVNTSKLKVLKSDETRELLIKSHNGDKAAREELISGNLRLVLSVCLLYTSRCV